MGYRNLPVNRTNVHRRYCLAFRHAYPSALSDTYFTIIRRLTWSTVAHLAHRYLIASSVAVFSFNGYEQAVYLTEEIRSVRTVIPKVIIGSLLLTLLLEIAPTVGVFLSADNLKALLTSASPFYDMVLGLGGTRVAIMVSAGIVLAVFNACIVNILMTARFFHSTGRDRFWSKGFGEALSTVGLQRTPWLATLIVGVASALVCCHSP